MFIFYTGFEKMERGLSEKYHDRVSPVKRHMDHMVAIGAAPGLINPHLNTMTSDVIKVRECLYYLLTRAQYMHLTKIPWLLIVMKKNHPPEML